MTDYQRALQLNPIVPFSPSGYHKANWFNYKVMSTSSVKSFQIFVYGNLEQDASHNANLLKQYFETTFKEDVAIGILSPKLDTTTLAYVVQMNMNVGSLRIPVGSAKPRVKQTIGTQQTHDAVDIVNRGIPIVNNGVQVRN